MIGTHAGPRPHQGGYSGPPQRPRRADSSERTVFCVEIISIESRAMTRYPRRPAPAPGGLFGAAPAPAPGGLFGAYGFPSRNHFRRKPSHDLVTTQARARTRGVIRGRPGPGARRALLSSAKACPLRTRRGRAGNGAIRRTRSGARCVALRRGCGARHGPLRSEAHDRSRPARNSSPTRVAATPRRRPKQSRSLCFHEGLFGAAPTTSPLGLGAAASPSLFGAKPAASPFGLGAAAPATSAFGLGASPSLFSSPATTALTAAAVPHDPYGGPSGNFLVGAGRGTAGCDVDILQRRKVNRKRLRGVGAVWGGSRRRRG